MPVVTVDDMAVQQAVHAVRKACVVRVIVQKAKSNKACMLKAKEGRENWERK